MVKCLGHDKCVEGFCDKGQCKSPSLNQPCKPGFCPAGSKCDTFRKRCVVGKVSPFDPCQSDLQCAPSEYCGEGKCHFRPLDACNAKTGCGWNKECYNGKCLDRCFSTKDCHFGGSCQSVGLAYNVCLKDGKGKPVEAVKVIHTATPPSPTPIVTTNPTFTYHEPTKDNTVLIFSVIGAAVLLVLAFMVFVIFMVKKKRTIPPPPPPMAYSSPMSPVIAAPVVTVPVHPQYPSTPPPYAQEPSPSYQMPQKY